jgi:hypothetical protein
VLPFHRRTAKPLSNQQESIGVRGVDREGEMDQMESSSGVKRETSSSSGMTAAKRQPAVETNVIVQNSLIDDFAEFGTRDTTGRGAG